MAETILQTIAEYARLRVKEAKRSIPLEEMKQKAFAERDRQRRGGRADFRFEEALKGPDIRFICECKKASPSRGMIAEEFPYVEIARSYEEAGGRLHFRADGTPVVSGGEPVSGGDWAGCDNPLSSERFYSGRIHAL